MTLADALVRILPLSIVMITGPQIITAVILAAAKNAVRETLKYIAGAIVGMTIVVGLTYFTGFTVTKDLELPRFADWALTIALVGAMISSFVKRHSAEKESRKDRKRSGTFVAGLLLLSLFPTDLLTNIGVGAALPTVDNPLLVFILFVVVTCLLLLIPLGIVLLLGDRAAPILAKIRQIITNYSWVLNEIICVLILVAIWKPAG